MQENDEPQLLKYKIVIIGDEAVGKTSMVCQFVHELHKIPYKPTLGCDFYTKVHRKHTLLNYECIGY